MVSVKGNMVDRKDDKVVCVYIGCGPDRKVSALLGRTAVEISSVLGLIKVPLAWNAGFGLQVS